VFDQYAKNFKNSKCKLHFLRDVTQVRVDVASLVCFLCMIHLPLVTAAVFCHRLSQPRCTQSSIPNKQASKQQQERQKIALSYFTAAAIVVVTPFLVAG
jgi:hypothetical protein